MDCRSKSLPEEWSFDGRCDWWSSFSSPWLPVATCWAVSYRAKSSTHNISPPGNNNHVQVKQQESPICWPQHHHSTADAWVWAGLLNQVSRATRTTKHGKSITVKFFVYSLQFQLKIFRFFFSLVFHTTYCHLWAHTFDRSVMVTRSYGVPPSHNILPLAGTRLCPLCDGDEVLWGATFTQHIATCGHTPLTARWWWRGPMACHLHTTYCHLRAHAFARSVMVTRSYGVPPSHNILPLAGTRLCPLCDGDEVLWGATFTQHIATCGHTHLPALWWWRGPMACHLHTTYCHLRAHAFARSVMVTRSYGVPPSHNILPLVGTRLCPLCDGDEVYGVPPSHNILPLAGTRLCPLCDGDEVLWRATFRQHIATCGHTPLPTLWWWRGPMACHLHTTYCHLRAHAFDRSVMVTRSYGVPPSHNILPLAGTRLWPLCDGDEVLWCATFTHNILPLAGTRLCPLCDGDEVLWRATFTQHIATCGHTPLPALWWWWGPMGCHLHTTYCHLRAHAFARSVMVTRSYGVPPSHNILPLAGTRLCPLCDGDEVLWGATFTQHIATCGHTPLPTLWWWRGPMACHLHTTYCHLRAHAFAHSVMVTRSYGVPPSHNILPLAGTRLCPLCDGDEVLWRATFTQHIATCGHTPLPTLWWWRGPMACHLHTTYCHLRAHAFAHSVMVTRSYGMPPSHTTYCHLRAHAFAHSVMVTRSYGVPPSHNILPLAGTSLCPLCDGDEVLWRASATFTQHIATCGHTPLPTLWWWRGLMACHLHTRYCHLRAHAFARSVTVTRSYGVPPSHNILPLAGTRLCPLCDSDEVLWGATFT